MFSCPVPEPAAGLDRHMCQHMTEASLDVDLWCCELWYMASRAKTSISPQVLLPHVWERRPPVHAVRQRRGRRRPGESQRGRPGYRRGHLQPQSAEADQRPQPAAEEQKLQQLGPRTTAGLCWDCSSSEHRSWGKPAAPISWFPSTPCPHCMWPRNETRCWTLTVHSDSVAT